jgi:adenylate cyclase
LADVFISYARDQQATASRVVKMLQAAGFDVWWDSDLPVHRSYSEIIESKLADAKAVVVLWSERAAQSQWVRAEAEYARTHHKLVQAQLDSSLPPMPFNQIQTADLKGWRGNNSHAGWAKLRSSVAALVGGEERPVAARMKPSLSERIWDRRWLLGFALVLLVAVGALFLVLGSPFNERKPVLAVLPFRSLDSRDDNLVAGMWEDTRQAIGRNPQLTVLGPNTAQDIAEKGDAAAKRAADYLIHASIRTAGERIRISADLVRTKDGEQVWSQDFDRKIDDVFALQSEIANAIEGHIRGRLARKGGVTPEHIATSREVYALYNDARAKLRKRDMAAYAEAHRELEQVVKSDPNFAPGWAALVFAMGTLPPSERHWDMTDRSEVYARKAIDLAPNLASGHSALGFSLGLKGPVARAEIERAVELDPNDYEAVLWLGNMRGESGDKKGAVDAYRRAAEIEPFFWPAILNLYSTLKDLGDEKAIQQLLEHERRLGADYLATSIEINDAYQKGNLAKAANIGLAYWKTGRTEGRSAIVVVLSSVMLQLGFGDEIANIGPAPDFAAALWRNDPRGLDLMESHRIDPTTFFSIQPLTENAARVYLLSGRGKTLANMYLSLKSSPEEFHKSATGDGPEHFLYSAPLIAIALKQNGHARDAAALLSLADSEGRKMSRSGKPLSSALLARIYALQGRKDDAIALLAAAINRGWLPQPPEILVDLHFDPALASLKGDPRFEKLREQILGRIARERAQVKPGLLRHLSKA